MVTSISVKNYKAFRDATLQIKPLTVLLGANSVGKSSMLQLLLLLKQTSTFGSVSDKVPLKMYGPFVNMGTTDNLFHNKDNKSILEFSISFKNASLQMGLNNLYRNYVQTVSTIPYLFPIKALLEMRSLDRLRDINREEFYDFTKKIFEILEKNKVGDYKQTLSYMLSGNSLIANDDISTSSLDTIMATYDLLYRIKKLGTHVKDRAGVEYTVSFSFCQKNKKLQICGIRMFSGNKQVFEIDMLKECRVSSEFCSFNQLDQQIIDAKINKSACIFYCFQDKKRSLEKNSTTLSNYVLKFLSMALSALKQEFNPNAINHVKPLRANPQRYYVIDDEKLTPYASSLDGERVIERLRDDDSVRQMVNKWLGRYNLSINIEQSEDVIHHIKIVQNDVELDIPDVGFGISQILPILVQSYCVSKETLTLIEQPEIHLHPIMQADVADLFKDAASFDKPFIIETHSEYLLRRIRRRVAKGDLSSNDVAIYMFKGKNSTRDCTEIQHLEMTATGAFEWPEDFYGGELYNDVIEYIVAQK